MKNNYNYGRTPWPEPRPKLRVGKWYLFKPLTALQKEQKCEQYKGDRAFKARVVGEYQRFYLLETEHYRTTMLKAIVGVEWEAIER